MVFVLNCFLLLVASLVPGKGLNTNEISRLVADPGIREAVLHGNADGLSSLLFQSIMGSKPGLFSSTSLTRNAVNALVPTFSALVLAENLLEILNAADREEKAVEFVSSGLFRKLGINGTVAPDLIRYTVRPDAGAEERLRAERDRLKRTAQKEISTLLREKEKR